jgi:hypothetical protein
MQKIKTFGKRRLCRKDKQIKNILEVRKMKEEINECNWKSKRKKDLLRNESPGSMATSNT